MFKRAVIFDFDGTLVDSQPHFDQGNIEFSIARGLSYDIKKMASGYVNPLKYDLGWNVPLQQQPTLLRELGDYLDNELLQNKRFIPTFFEGVEDILDELKNSYALGIVTMRGRATTLATLEHHGRLETFPAYRTLCCARERNYNVKPSADALNCLLNEMNFKSNNAIVIGDTTSDIRMAHEAGVRSIAVLWGAHSSEMLAQANPTLMIDKVKDMPGAIEKAFSMEIR